MKLNGALLAFAIAFITAVSGCGGGGTAPAGSGGLRSLAQATNRLVLNPVTQTVWASVPSTAVAYGNSVIEIDPTSGKILGSTFVGDEPGPMAISTDGSKLFVALESSAMVAVVNTSTRTEIQTFSVDPGNAGMFQTISDVAVQPGSTNTIAVTLAIPGSSASTGPEIISNGVILPNALGSGQGQSLTFVSPFQLAALDNADTSLALYECMVNASGVSIVSTVDQSITLNQAYAGFLPTIQCVGGRIYSSTGAILNGTTGAKIGNFAVASPVRCAIDLQNDRAFFINGSFFYPPNVSIQSFSATTFQPVASASLPRSDSGQILLDLFRFGARGLVFRSSSTVYFMDQAPGL